MLNDSAANGKAPARAHRKCANAKLSLRQAIEMQEILHELIVSRSGNLIALASGARAWSDLEDRKRILRGKPLPGAFKPGAPEPRKRKAEVAVSEG